MWFLSLDKAIGIIEKACEDCGYVLLVTADHGNAETMIDQNGKPVTKHTTNKGSHDNLSHLQPSWVDLLVSVHCPFSSVLHGWLLHQDVPSIA